MNTTGDKATRSRRDRSDRIVNKLARLGAKLDRHRERLFGDPGQHGRCWGHVGDLVEVEALLDRMLHAAGPD